MLSDEFGFGEMVRDYLDGKVDWDSVHQRAVKMEYENKAEFPAGYEALQEIHTIFLTADAKDDPQFRADRDEIANLLAQFERFQANRPQDSKG